MADRQRNILPTLPYDETFFNFMAFCLKIWRNTVAHMSPLLNGEYYISRLEPFVAKFNDLFLPERDSGWWYTWGSLDSPLWWEEQVVTHCEPLDLQSHVTVNYRLFISELKKAPNTKRDSIVERTKSLTKWKTCHKFSDDCWINSHWSARSAHVKLPDYGALHPFFCYVTMITKTSTVVNVTS